MTHYIIERLLGFGVAGTLSLVIGILCAVAGSLVFMLMGIFALIPYTPLFHERDLAIGISFIVLTITGIIGGATFIVGALIGFCFGMPCIFCCPKNNDD